MTWCLSIPASKILPPPEVIEYETISIIKPNGPDTVENPLYAYRFKSTKGFPGYFEKFPTTLRHPTSFESDAKSNPKALKM